VDIVCTGAVEMPRDVSAVAGVEELANMGERGQE